MLSGMIALADVVVKVALATPLETADGSGAWWGVQALKRRPAGSRAGNLGVRGTIDPHPGSPGGMWSQNRPGLPMRAGSDMNADLRSPNPNFFEPNLAEMIRAMRRAVPATGRLKDRQMLDLAKAVLAELNGQLQRAGGAE